MKKLMINTVIINLLISIAIFPSLFSTEAIAQQELKIGYAVTPILNTDAHQADAMTEGNYLALWAETLVRMEDGELVPQLATNWEVQDDKLTWRVDLREDVYFHDGTHMDAEMVKLNFERLLDPDIASPSRGMWEVLEEVNVVDNYTLDFVTTKPLAPFPSNLTHYSANIMNVKAAEEQGMDDFNRKAVGTGPFVITEHVIREEFVLEPFKNHWRDNPQLDRVTVQHIAEEASATAALMGGEIDLIWRLPRSQVPIIEQAPEIEVATNPAYTIYYMGFNLEKELLDDYRIRKAIHRAVDLESIIAGAFQGIGTMHGGTFGPTMRYFPDIDLIDHDLDRAEELLAEAGYPDGIEEPLKLLTWGDPERVRAAEIVQEQLAQVGIEIEIDVWEFGAFLSETQEGNMDLYFLSWSNATGDPDINLYGMFHSSEIPGRNRSRVNDPELDSLIEAQREEFDPEKREKLVYEATKYVYEEIIPWVPKFTDEWVVGIREEVKGFEVPVTGNLNLSEVYIQQ